MTTEFVRVGFKGIPPEPVSVKDISAEELVEAGKLKVEVKLCLEENANVVDVVLVVG